MNKGVYWIHRSFVCRAACTTVPFYYSTVLTLGDPPMLISKKTTGLSEDMIEVCVVVVVLRKIKVVWYGTP